MRSDGGATGGKKSALTPFLSASVASLSLIHVNLSSDSISAVAHAGRALRLSLELDFLQKHFADGVQGRR